MGIREEIKILPFDGPEFGEGFNVQRDLGFQDTESLYARDLSSFIMKVAGLDQLLPENPLGFLLRRAAVGVLILISEKALGPPTGLVYFITIHGIMKKAQDFFCSRSIPAIIRTIEEALLDVCDFLYKGFLEDPEPFDLDSTDDPKERALTLVAYYLDKFYEDTMEEIKKREIKKDLN